ncbi:uncharacterized protein FPRO_07863 [Fusarium proliferatum ET1]|uniref:Uncharacterized protein n=1 Tax=Fusarium proliferatum (strain ET1) TaxID=1227346 RepID=A0A1L7VS16_FUSPR|nr:uncharacterized protein FPRO_07863 [Fusarium proliferatum ET1]CZR43221.1 uncharacterized protein FPRO_07863 [Fusarium proliferatum ET1]
MSAVSGWSRYICLCLCLSRCGPPDQPRSFLASEEKRKMEIPLSPTPFSCSSVSASCRFVHWSYREMVTLSQRRLAVGDLELESPWSCLDRGIHTLFALDWTLYD